MGYALNFISEGATGTIGHHTCVGVVCRPLQISSLLNTNLSGYFIIA